MRKTVLVTPRERVHLLVPETEIERVTGANGGIPRPYAGLVFNFDPPKIATMTMRKTPMALQIAFVSPQGVVHTVYDAKARSGLYSSPLLTRWVIETFLPWHVLQHGDAVQFALS